MVVWKNLINNIQIDLFDVPQGVYQLGVAIVNKRLDNKPEIKLALKDTKTVKGWNVLGKIDVVK